MLSRMCGYDVHPPDGDLPERARAAITPVPGPESVAASGRSGRSQKKKKRKAVGRSVGQMRHSVGRSVGRWACLISRTCVQQIRPANE